MMRINRKVKIVCSILFIFILKSLVVSAQGTYKYRSAIQKIDSSGVYKIELQPGFVSKSKNKELYDIRVVDETGKFIAYAVVNNPLEKVKPTFIGFPEVKQKVYTDSTTIYIAENKSKFNISQLWLKLKNTDVARLVNISGSDNLQHWFAIKEDIQLQDAGSESNPEYEQMLNFPTSNYRYLRIQITNKNKDLIKIVKSGIYVSDEIGKTEFALLPPVKLSSKNHNKQTSYFADIGDKYVVNELHLNIASPKYYNRHISVYDVGNKAEEKLYDDSISSSGQGYLPVYAKTNKLRIDIMNGDDNPLVISGITALQQKEFVVSYLEKNHSYYLLTGDTSANEVSYDLSFLHSSPLSEFPIISHSVVEISPAYKISQPVVKHNFTLLLWIAIIVVLLLLSFLTWKMVNEINSKQKTTE
ncbi:MAG: hypothetical protein JWP37_1813 [Mucilaginibacter sp.]|nr:hypothetical protein [Mucilaginibacter sp.]